MDREEFEDLRRYMDTAQEALRCAYNNLLDFQTSVSYGLSLSDDPFDNGNICELGKRLTRNRDKINDVLIREIDDKLSSM